MKRNICSKPLFKATAVVLLNLIFLHSFSQNAVKSTPLGIGKQCGSSKDSFRLMSYDDTSKILSVSYACKPNLGGGSPTGPAFSSSAGSIAFNPKDQKVYYIATTTGNNSFVYSWVPNQCPTTKQKWDYYYPGQFVVGLDFDPSSTNGDGYQLELVGASAPYTCFLRKVNFASNYFGPSVQINLSAGKKIYQQRGDIIFTPQGDLFFAFDDKLFKVDYSNYGSGSVSGTFIDTLAFSSGYHLTGISYADGKFIGSTQGSGCAFKEIDISNGSAVISNVTLEHNNYTAVDMATLINGIGVAKTLRAVTPATANKWVIQFDIKIRNFGNSVLNNVQLIENLSAVFGGALGTVSVTPVGTLPSGLKLNSAYDGVSNTNIFVGGPSSILNTSPADSAIVRVEFELNNPDLNTTYLSSSIGSATDKLFGTTIADSSNNDMALRSDLNANGLPDDANEDVPTPLMINEWIVLANNIVDFNGSYADKKVELHWSMANAETGIIANIQRSADGKNFQTVYSRPITASSKQETYKWTDISPLPKDNFYRLEFVRQDGSVFYSETLSLASKRTRPVEPVVSPNPFSEQIQFSVHLDKPQQMRYKLMGMDLKVIASGEKTGAAGTNKFRIDNLSNVSAGSYLLQVSIGDESFHKVLIKSH